MLLAAEGRGKRDGEQGVIRHEGEGRGHDGGADGAGDEEDDARGDVLRQHRFANISCLLGSDLSFENVGTSECLATHAYLTTNGSA